MNTKIILLLACVGSMTIPATTKALDPTAVATAPNITTAGDTAYSLTVKYSDDGLLPDAFGDDNVRITGPNGFNVLAKFVSFIFSSGGRVATVTYSIVPPGGSWDSADNGNYSVVMQANVVFDTLGNAVPAGDIGSFNVAVSGPPATSAGGLANISTRLRVENGDNVLIGGFIITGTQPKKIIVRAIGPSLAFADKLPDPSLEFYQGSTLLETNDNWADSLNKQAIIDSTVPPGNSLESAIVRTLAPGAYTAVVRGVNGATGTAVVEAYDLDTAVNSKLANISTRGLVQTGDNVLFAGMIVLGPGNQKVIVRALGPSVPIAGTMADPSLELRDANGASAEANDNWMESPNKQAIIDSTVPPGNASEAAIVRTLPPGNFTAIVRGANNTTGIAVVEVFALN